MKPAGRLVGIGYFIFGLLNLAVFYFAPGRQARLARFMDVEQSMFPWMRSTQANSPFQADMMPFFIIGAVFGVALCLVPIYFLAAAKPAFDRACGGAGGVEGKLNLLTMWWRHPPATYLKMRCATRVSRFQ